MQKNNFSNFWKLFLFLLILLLLFLLSHLVWPNVLDLITQYKSIIAGMFRPRLNSEIMLPRQLSTLYNELNLSVYETFRLQSRLAQTPPAVNISTQLQLVQHPHYVNKIPNTLPTTYNTFKLIYQFKKRL